MKTDYRDLCGVPHHMMSYTDLHLRQAILLIHRRMVIFSLFTALFSFYSESISLPYQKDREKGRGFFFLFSNKKGNGIGVTKIKVRGYSYTTSWAVHNKPMNFWATKWNLSTWLPWQIYISTKIYIYFNVQDSCNGYDHGV